MHIFYHLFFSFISIFEENAVLFAPFLSCVK
ncbi:hypothetical protein BCE_2188 [Bacillus cereus ATCC 10987]|uniref:Uncharacterized protein n=1 Tax=Bacillus cereus (strain ATCC 10987 / NRS 248) TaxID=222523 RepID=Q739F3_BACC1|nr:hypothetical protein BCE_2188 [Bacillus cereus ATCC 10987]